MLFNYNEAVYRIIIITVLVMFSRTASAFRPLIYSNKGKFRTCNLSSYISENFCSTEVAIYHGGEEEIKTALNLLALKRPQLEIISTDNDRVEGKESDGIVWSAHSDLIQLDCKFLEPLFLGKNKLSNEETAQKWDEEITGRLNLLDDSSDGIRRTPHLGDGGTLQDELDSALAVVHRASFMSRLITSIQTNGFISSNFLLTATDSKNLYIPTCFSTGQYKRNY